MSISIYEFDYLTYKRQLMDEELRAQADEWDELVKKYCDCMDCFASAQFKRSGLLKLLGETFDKYEQDAQHNED